jgi:hypothetical protein
MFYADFLFPDDLAQAKGRYPTNGILTGMPFSFQLRRMDGMSVWVSIELNEIKGADQKVYAISAVVTGKYRLPGPAALERLNPVSRYINGHRVPVPGSTLVLAAILIRRSFVVTGVS